MRRSGVALPDLRHKYWRNEASSMPSRLSTPFMTTFESVSAQDLQPEIHTDLQTADALSS